MSSVGEDFPIQQARVREIQKHAREIGPAGAFLVHMCEVALRESEQAAISGDVLRVLTAYEALKGFEE